MRKTIYTLFVLSVAMSCRNTTRTVEPSHDFSLSDTMLATTKFQTASLQPVRSELKLYGKVTAANSKTSAIFPVVGGYVQKVNVELGDYVTQGQSLAVIRSSEVAGYDKERLDASNDLAIAEKNFQVAQDMYEGKLYSEKDVMAAKTEVEKAQTALKRINEVYGIYNMKPGAFYTVTAPISGFITEKNITQNVLIDKDNINKLFTIAQIDEVWVIANVNESDISIIRPGMTAAIKTISYPDHIFTGKVDKIFSMLDADTRSMKVRINIANEDLILKPEMSATVTLRYDENRQMIAIPSSAIVFDKSRNWVMVYHDRNNIETRAVEVYKQLGDITYIKTGLAANEKIITQNQLLIYDELND